MALVTTFICMVCHNERYEVVSHSSPGVCFECCKLADQAARAQHLKGLEALTVEERLKKIEAWIYDYKLTRQHDIKYA